MYKGAIAHFTPAHLLVVPNFEFLDVDMKMQGVSALIIYKVS